MDAILTEKRQLTNMLARETKAARAMNKAILSFSDAQIIFNGYSGPGFAEMHFFFSENSAADLVWVLVLVGLLTPHKCATIITFETRWKVSPPTRTVKNNLGLTLHLLSVHGH